MKPQNKPLYPKPEQNNGIKSIRAQPKIQTAEGWKRGQLKLKRDNRPQSNHI